MPVVAVVGAQWGDEGKGKVVDDYTHRASVVARYGGGANAGHTIYVNGERRVIHNLPSGIYCRGLKNMLGPGALCDPDAIIPELAAAKEAGAHVIIDRDCPVVLPIHKQLDALRERQSGAAAIGSTKQGIGPAYESFVSRRGPTAQDLCDRAHLAAYLSGQHHAMLLAQVAHLGDQAMPPDELLAWADRARAHLHPYLGDVRHELAQLQAKHGATIVCEGAQGIMLDLYHGQKPYKTCAPCGLGGIVATLGITKVDRVIGVAKGYVTRVGAGPFPTEQDNEIGEDIRQRGQEFGATTGRPRRCGWLDIPALRYAIRMGGITEIVLNKMDILEPLPEIPVCTAYELDGRRLTTETLTTSVLERVTPVYHSLPGWNGVGVSHLSDCRHWSELPLQLQTNIETIDEWLGVPVTGIGVNAEHVVWKKE